MGWFDEVTRTFEVYNQPLYAYPNLKNTRDIFVENILTGDDFDTLFKRHLVFRLSMATVRRFNRKILEGTYPYGFAEVEVEISSQITEEMIECLSVRHGEGFEFVESFFYRNTTEMSDYDFILGSVYERPAQADFTLVPDINHTLGYIEFEEPITLDYLGGTITDCVFVAGIGYVTASYTTGGDNPQDKTITFSTDVVYPPPTGRWATLGYSYNIDGNPFTNVWLYQVGSGECPAIDNGENLIFNFGSTGDVVECFPDIPIRLRNIDYNDPRSPLDEDAIRRQLKYFGIIPKDVLKEIFDEDSEADPNDMDNVFIKFGIRVWDESQSGREYLYTFFKEVLRYLDETGAANIDENCLSDDTELPEEESGNPLENPGMLETHVIPKAGCHQIHITTEFSKFRLFFASISEEFYSLPEIKASGDLSMIYYSDARCFDENEILIKDYHSSSGELLRSAGYRAMDMDDVVDYIAGGGKKSVRQPPPLSMNVNWLKPSVRITNGIDRISVYSSGGALIEVSVLVPEDIYARYRDGIQLVDPLLPETVRQITYYLCLGHGMHAITVYGMGGQTLVMDTESEEQRLVTLSIHKTNKLTVPIMFGLIDNKYWVNQNSMISKTESIAASLHMTIYVANVTTTELPWWAIVLKVITFVIAIILAVYTVGGSIAAAKAFAFMMVAVVVYPVLSEISPWLAIGVSVALIAYGGYQSISSVIAQSGTTTQLLTEILKVGIKLAASGANVVQLVNAGKMEEAQKLLEDQGLEADNAKKRLEMMEGGGDADMILNALTNRNGRGTPNPIDPERYFYIMDNMTEIGVDSLNVENLLNLEPQLPGVA